MFDNPLTAAGRYHESGGINCATILVWFGPVFSLTSDLLVRASRLKSAPVGMKGGARVGRMFNKRRT